MRGNKFSSKKTVFMLFLLAFFLRILGFINIKLDGDFAYHWSVAGGIIERNVFPTLGPGASINKNIFLGPSYYYLLSLPYLLGGGNYKVAIVFFSLINSLSVYPLFYVSKKWTDEDSAIKIVLLYCVSSYLIQVQNFPWNAYEIPLFVILSLYFLEKVKEGVSWYLPPLFLLLSFGVQMHATFLFLIPLFFLFIPYKKINGWVIIFSLCAPILPFLPWLSYEIGHGFIQTKESMKILLTENSNCSFFDWLNNHGHGERCFHYFRNTLLIFRQFSLNLFSSSNLFFAFLSFAIGLYVALKKLGKNAKFYTFWMVSVFIQYLFYSGNVYPHYFLILVPLPFIFIILFLREVEKRGKWGKAISTVIYLVLINYNIINYLISLKHLRR